jgi:hypothetical protein
MQRPASVTIFGILNVLFAAFGVVGLIASFALFSVPEDPNSPVVKLLHQNASYTVWLKFCILLGLLSCVVLLAAGVGLLGLKPWARTLSMGYAIFAVVFAMMAMGINLFVMIQPLFEQVPPQQERAVAGAIGGPLSGTVGGCLGLIYPLVLLAFMLRPKVASAFRPPSPPQPQT